MSLSELEAAADEINAKKNNQSKGKSNLLVNVLDDDVDENNIEKPCLICHL